MILIVIFVSIGCNLFDCDESDLEVFSPFFHRPPIPDVKDERGEGEREGEGEGESEHDESEDMHSESDYTNSESEVVEMDGFTERGRGGEDR